MDTLTKGTRIPFLNVKGRQGVRLKSDRASAAGSTGGVAKRSPPNAMTGILRDREPETGPARRPRPGRRGGEPRTRDSRRRQSPARGPPSRSGPDSQSFGRRAAYRESSGAEIRDVAKAEFTLEMSYQHHGCARSRCSRYHRRGRPPKSPKWSWFQPRACHRHRKRVPTQRGQETVWAFFGTRRCGQRRLITRAANAEVDSRWRPR